MKFQAKHLIQKEHVFFLKEETKQEVIKALIGHLKEGGVLASSEEFLTAVLQREKLVSTGIGMGVAIPHAKLASVKNFFIAVGISKKGIEWNALDEAPVKLIFLIGGPSHLQNTYLHILSEITILIKDPIRRKKLLNAEDKEDIVRLLQQFPI